MTQILIKSTWASRDHFTIFMLLVIQISLWGTFKFLASLCTFVWQQMEMFMTANVAYGFVAQNHAQCHCLTMCSALWTAPLALHMQHPASTAPFKYQTP